MGLNVPLLRESFKIVSLKGDLLSELFYDTLFSRYPETRALFQTANMEEQRKKLIRSLDLIVRNLEKPDFLVHYVQGLGLMHLAYGTEEAHYDPVGECLLYAMAEVAGDLWNAELEKAWGEAYGVVADMMKQGAQYESARAAA